MPGKVLNGEVRELTGVKVALRPSLEIVFASVWTNSAHRERDSQQEAMSIKVVLALIELICTTNISITLHVGAGTG